MAGRGMGAATRGGGCVGTGPRNKVQSKPSRKVGDPVMMNKGGEAKKFPDLNKDGKVSKADVPAKAERPVNNGCRRKSLF